MRKRVLRYGVLDVVAQPHPEGIYRRIFDVAVGMVTHYWGTYSAAITPLSQTRDGVFTGRLAVWMAIEEDANVINLESFSEVPLSNSEDVIIPDDRGLNSRMFEFAFNVNSHKLILQLNNDDGKNISPRRAEVALQEILSRAANGMVDELRVQVVPDSDSVNRILKLPRLSSLEIVLHRPNPDSLSDEINAVLQDELDDQNVREVVKILRKAPGAASIDVNERNTLLVKAAASNGYAKGVGRDEEDRPIEVSTRDHPLIIRRESAERGTEFGGVRGLAGE